MANLRLAFRRVRRRLLSLGALGGVAWSLVAATVLFLLGAWLDLLWEFSPAWRIATLATAGLGGAICLGALAVLVFRAARTAALARRLDHSGRTGGRILTGWELASALAGATEGGQSHFCSGKNWDSRLSAGMATLAIEDAAAAASRVVMADAVPIRPARRSLATLVVLWAALGAAALCLPNLALTQWSRFWRPFDDVPPYSLTSFEVSPGDVSLVYGSELEIHAKPIGPPVEQVELVLKSARGDEPPLPMFPEPDGTWRAVLAKVTEPTDYFVRAYRARSLLYHVRLITVPRIEEARLRIMPPAYANRAAYEGPLPKEGVAGLLGTKVQIFLRSNRPLSGGTIALAVAKTGKPAGSISMTPTEPGGHEVVGEFRVGGDGKFECRVSDEEGQASQQSFSGSITVLADERPFVRITQPQKVSLATPTAMLPVMLSAEDDCGISRLQLFRSLNDSRPLPADLKVPAPSPRRFDDRASLPLEKYGLEPGDVLKFFGRVEDNDPVGAKGAESSVVTVRIVSQEDFERMFRMREGVQAVFSKYYAARRHMEGIAKEMDDLRKQLDKLPPGDKAGDDIRRELKRLGQRLRKESEALRKLAEHSLPYDLDKNLAPHLQRLINLTDEMAQELDKMLTERDVINGKLGGRLGKLAKRLADQRKQYDESATQPLEFFEAAFPLLMDQSRFITLYEWQKDLAERMAALKGREHDDSPALRARMRDLEQEQWQVREALDKFVEGMQEHIEKLPDKAELAELRQTARQFLVDLRSSGASDAMVAAEAALAEFAPTKAHEKAQEAADILNKFIKRCNGIGGNVRGALAFQPSLSNCLGNTIDQLLADMQSGVGPGGSMGGYGMVGLYGGLPEMFGGGREGQAEEGSGQGTNGAGRGGSTGGKNPDADTANDAQTPGAAAGASEAGVPLRYRRQVGQYFERVADETNEKGR